MRKKSVFFTFLILVTWFFAGCSKLEKRQKRIENWFFNNGKLKVVCTTSPLKDITEALGVGLIDVESLIDAGLDPHAYELVKGDGEKLERADIIIASGLGLEHGASIEHILNTSQKVVSVGSFFKKHFKEKLIITDGELDPHIWMDVALFSEALEPICLALCEKMPQHKTLLEQRKEKLKARLFELHCAIKKRLGALPKSRRYLVTAHDAFHYFTRAYLLEPGEDISGAWKKRLVACEGLAPEGQVSFADMKSVIHFIQKYRVKVAFPESNIGRGFLIKVLEITKNQAKNRQKQGYEGIDFSVAKEPLCADTMLGEEGFDYVCSMTYNAEVIYRYLSEGIYEK